MGNLKMRIDRTAGYDDPVYDEEDVVALITKLTRRELENDWKNNKSVAMDEEDRRRSKMQRQAAKRARKLARTQARQVRKAARGQPRAVRKVERRKARQIVRKAR